MPTDRKSSGDTHGHSGIAQYERASAAPASQMQTNTGPTTKTASVTVSSSRAHGTISVRLVPAISRRDDPDTSSR